jgi:hypothetical protein
MNVDDVMSLPKNRKPSAIDAVSLMMLRDKAYRDVVSEEFAARSHRWTRCGRRR